jgi:hypothetical protein
MGICDPIIGIILEAEKHGDRAGAIGSIEAKGIGGGNKPEPPLKFIIGGSIPPKKGKYEFQVVIEK